MEGGYFDNNATTPLDPRVFEAMRPWLENLHGNPSSIHAWGRKAREAVEVARDHVARLIGAEPPEIVFTGSGTEANNAVLMSCARGCGFAGSFVVASFEHPSIQAATDLVESLGVAVKRVPPGSDGCIDPSRMIDAIEGDTVLVCLMRANNELGTLQPVAEVASAARDRGCRILCDAVQAAGKIPIDVAGLGVDFLTVGGHKFHGPLGAAALWIRGGTEFRPYLVGGSQERQRRASTVNVPAVVGFGEAARLAYDELEERQAFLGALQSRFEEGVRRIPGAIVHCADSPRLPSTSHVAFPGVDGTGLLIRLDLAGFAVSTGSACSSGAGGVSATLQALDLPLEESAASLRVSFGMMNTADEVEALLAAIGSEIEALRSSARATG